MALTKKKLYEYLETTGGFHKNIDSWIVDEFLYTLSLIQKTKKQIKDDGHKIIINVSSKPGVEVLQPSAAFAGYKSLIRQALDLSKQLPLSPMGRKMLKEAVEKESDDFNA